MLTPVRRQSLSDSVFEQLKEQIVRGQMPPGEALPAERALCATLGVNRGALREGLKRLEQAGLVRIQHGGGTRVADFMRSGGLELLPDLLFGPGGMVNTRVARSVIELRSALAQDLGRRAAERATPEQAAGLAARVSEMEDADGALDRLQPLAMAFWGQAVEASGNVAYRLAYNTLARTYAPIFDLLTQALADELADLAGYRALAEAIGGGEADIAAELARTITHRGEQGLLRILEALDAIQPPEEDAP